MNATTARIKGLLYLLALLILTIGIPFALYAFAGNPLAFLSDLNTFDELTSAVITQDDGTLFLAVLTLVGWIAWATFTFSIAVELFAALRGVRPQKIRGLQLQQRSAAMLVGGALMLLTAGTATAAPIQHITGPVHAAPAAAPTQAPTVPAWTTAPANMQVGDTITATHGDTLWSLAEQHLGDGTRYPEIRNLNHDTISDDNWIHAGWTLRLPAQPQTSIAGAYTVQPGDTLWDIAEQHLGAGTRYAEIEGIDGPLASNVILIGQQLIINPVHAPAGERTPGPVADQTPVPAPVTDPVPAPAPAPLDDRPADTPAPESPPTLPTAPPAPQDTGSDPTTIPETAPEVEATEPGAVQPPASAVPVPTPELSPAAPPSAAQPLTPAPDAPPQDEPKTDAPPLVVPDVPEQQEMVPGGDEMSQAEALAAAQAAADIFNLPPEVALGTPPPTPVPAPVPIPLPAPEPPAAANTPTTEQAPAETATVQPTAPETRPQHMPETQPELPVEPQPVPAPAIAPPMPVPAPTPSATQIPLNTSPEPAPHNAAHITALPTTDADAHQSDYRSILGISALASIALLGALGTLRQRQQHRRRRGEKIPLPIGPAAETEDALRNIADPDPVASLDTALRHLAHHCRTTGLEIPALLGVFLHTNSIELALLEDIDIPAPWTRSDESAAWSVPIDAPLDAPPTAISPYPALVELGDLPDGARILLNLEELTHLEIAAPHGARDIVRALAVFLAFSPLADNLHLTLVGVGEELPNLIDNRRITYADNADTVLERLARTTTTDADTLTAEGISSIAQARATYDDSEMTAPEIVVLAHPLTPAQRTTLDTILTNTPRIAFAAVTAHSDHTPDWTLTTDSDGNGQLARNEGAAFELTPTQLTSTDYDALITLLATAHADPEPTTTSLNDFYTAEQLDMEISEATSADELIPTSAATYSLVITPEEEADQPDAAAPAPATAAPPIEPATTEHIWIRLLGTPKVTPLNGSDAPKGREPGLTELAALLATHPGILHHDIDTKLWPHDNFNKLDDSERAKKKAVRRQNNFTRLRGWLGETETGALAFPKSGDRTGRSGYTLDPNVHTDWNIFNNLIDEHPARATDEQLTTAANLVTGQPFTTPTPTRYTWAEHLQQNMISTVTDTLEELAARHIHQGNTKTARTIAIKGLDVDPVHEGLWRLAIIATHARSDITATQQLINEMLANLAELEVEPDEETAALLNLLDDFHDTTGARPYRISSQAS